MGYVSRFDALRGLCVLAVFAFHARLLAFGWIGVQVFFVLSGYLITAILCDMKLTGGGARNFFTVFYARRSLRILPAYYVAVFLITLFLAVTTSYSGPLWNQFAEALPFLLVYADNFHSAAPHYGNSGYFSHLWSLCVEEQFYLVWPLVIWLTPARKLPFVCIAAIGISLAYRTGVVALDTSEHFRWVSAARLPFAHLDAFAIGALVRIVPPPAALLRWRVVALSLAAVFAAGMVMHLAARGTAQAAGFYALGWSSHLGGAHGFVWAYLVLNLASALLIALLDRTASLPLPRFAAFFDFPALLVLGKLSYGFYIFHDPVITALAPYDRGSMTMRATMTIVAFLMALALATISYLVIERPFLALKRRWRRPGDVEQAPAPLSPNEEEIPSLAVEVDPPVRAGELGVAR